MQQDSQNLGRGFHYGVCVLLLSALWSVWSQSLHANERSELLDLSSLSLAGIYVLPIEERVKVLNFQLENLRLRREITLSHYRDKVLVLNFWATWCPPCRAEMPAIEALHQALKDQGLVWLAINSGEDRATIKSYIDKYSYTFPILLDPRNSNMRKYGIQGLPATIIVNKSGYVVALAMGSVDWRSPEVIAAFQKLLAE